MQLLMCEFYLHKHKYEQAIELAQEARSLAESKRVRKNIAKSHWLEGQAQLAIMRIDKALGHLNQAVELVDEIQHGSLRWKIRLDLAEALVIAGKSPLGVTQQARDFMNLSPGCPDRLSRPVVRHRLRGTEAGGRAAELAYR